MVAEYVSNGKNFELSVLGDFNKDGILNQIELTRQIRNVLEVDEWKINSEIELLSVDIKRDKK